jgi:4'-phosphopantetheinyl transferase
VSLEREVRVWTVRQDAIDDEALSRYHRLLSPDEHERARRFLRPDDTARFVIGRALIRTLLSRSAGNVPPREWPLRVNEYGRPELAERPPGVADLRFNLSHTPGLIACAMTIGREVGVDVETTRRVVLHDVPERFFSAREVADLRALPHSDQHSVFFDYWTLKEAYIKARGFGLALPLRQFSFIRLPAGAPTIEFGPELHDDPSTWQFGQFWPTRDHRMAVAVRRHGTDLPIVVEDAIPEVRE